MIIVDTNVIAYLLIPGPESPSAESARLKDPVWAAPKLWRSEMRNVLMLYLRQKLMTMQDVKSTMASAEQLLNGYEFDVASARVLELAVVSGCTAYDCEFIYLAEALSVPLVTSDKKLLSAFPQIAVTMNDFLIV